jgi:integrase
VSILVRQTVAVSLRTKEANEAKRRFRDVSKQIERLYTIASDTAVTLSHEETIHLAGEWRRSLIVEYRANPGDAEGWEVEFDRVAEALEYFVPDGDPDWPSRERNPFNPEVGERLLTGYLKPDLFLKERGLKLTPQSRLAFLREAGEAHLSACRRLVDNARGDYSPDKAEGCFPAGPFKRQADARGTDIWALLEAWALERKPAQSSLKGYKLSVSEFVESVGHTDASRYARADVLKWKDEMVAAGRPAKTIDDSKLATLKAIQNHAVDNEKLKINPAARVSVGKLARKKAGTKMLPYDDHEAVTLLAAAVADARPVIRWVPLLCAMTGARVSEMMQLRKEDVFPDHGVWSIKITPDAGDLKNAASERTIPLHPCLVKRGFLDFLKDRPTGPLFFNRARRRDTSSTKPGKGATNHLREFLHGVAEREGLKIGRAFRKDPNHAWRHRFVTEARKHHMDAEKREYALGHTLGDEGYGGMAGLLLEFAKLPDPLTGQPLAPELSHARILCAANDRQ